MYFCNAQLIISPWKLRNINRQFIIIIIIIIKLQYQV